MLIWILSTGLTVLLTIFGTIFVGSVVVCTALMGGDKRNSVYSYSLQSLLVSLLILIGLLALKAKFA